MIPLEIKKDIYWIGIADFTSKDFHGYSLSPCGTSYNSYLIKDEKTVLFDSVKGEYAEEYVKCLKRVIEPQMIDYLVVSHAELDHSGALQELVSLCKPEKIFCSAAGKAIIQKYFNSEDWPLETVKSGDKISIGKRTIEFIDAKMLHWPDSMFSYIREDKLLITNDAFGENIASSERFSDEIPRFLLEHAMNEYYHNIILPFSARVQAVLAALGAMSLDIDMIAPDHGLIIRGKEDVDFVLDLYSKYAAQKPQKRALIIYDTMWNSTKKMANALAEGISAEGVPVRVLFIKQHHHSMIMSELARCGLLVTGSPTHNNGILPLLAGVLTYIKGLKPKNRLGAAFGSYGWSGESADHLHKCLEEMGFELPIEPLKAHYLPDDEMLDKCRETGRILARALIEKVNTFKTD